MIRAREKSNGTIFQSDLVEKSDFSKVKVSRILDKLEGRQLIERKRRGMTNVVVLMVDYVQKTYWQCILRRNPKTVWNRGETSEEESKEEERVREKCSF